MNKLNDCIKIKMIRLSCTVLNIYKLFYSSFMTHICEWRGNISKKHYTCISFYKNQYFSRYFGAPDFSASISRVYTVQIESILSEGSRVGAL